MLAMAVDAVYASCVARTNRYAIPVVMALAVFAASLRSLPMALLVILSAAPHWQ
jgi:hypothetical protein